MLVPHATGMVRVQMHEQEQRRDLVVDSILAHGLDAQPLPAGDGAQHTTDPPRRHEQLRGPGYYQ